MPYGTTIDPHDRVPVDARGSAGSGHRGYISLSRPAGTLPTWSHKRGNGWGESREERGKIIAVINLTAHRTRMNNIQAKVYTVYWTGWSCAVCGMVLEKCVRLLDG